MQVTVKVRQFPHVHNGVRKRAEACPVALAFKDLVLPECSVYVTTVRILVTYPNEDADCNIVGVPVNVVEAINRYDVGEGMKDIGCGSGVAEQVRPSSEGETMYLIQAFSVAPYCTKPLIDTVAKDRDRMEKVVAEALALPQKVKVVVRRDDGTRRRPTRNGNVRTVMLFVQYQGTERDWVALQRLRQK